MLQIKTTPNLYGIILMGDYLDLDALYDSLSRYLAFYQDNMSQFQPYHEYEYLLSLNYDIRHAYQGDRGTEIMENNAEATGMMAENIYEISPAAKEEFRNIRKSFSKGNLYFSVEILYPLVFHYLILQHRYYHFYLFFLQYYYSLLFLLIIVCFHQLLYFEQRNQQMVYTIQRQ